MITRSRDQKLWCISCDKCPESDEFERADFAQFADLLAHIREDGWTYAKDANGLYEHFCPECSSKGT